MAAIIGPLIIGGSSLFGGLFGASAAKSAAAKQAQAAQQALEFQKAIYEKNQAYLSPFIQGGQEAFGKLGSLYGPNGVTPEGTAAFKSSPDYQFALEQGNQGVTHYENATGMGMSGSALKDVSNFNQGLASQQFGNYFSRLMGLSQLGEGAAASLAGSNTNMGGQIGNTMQGIGQAQASGIVGGANSLMSGINSGMNNALMYNFMSNKDPSSFANQLNNFFNKKGLIGMPNG